ncbi:MAG: MlaD family protein [Phycisphaerales bacterium]
MNERDRAERRRDFAIGLTAIGALGGFAALLMAFGKLQPLLSRPFPVVLEANTASGVRAGSQVTLNGVPVGSVESVAVDPAWTPPVRIRLGLQRDARVPADVSVRLGESLIGGGSTVELLVPAGHDPAAPVLAAADPPPVVRAHFQTMSERIAAALDSAQRAFAAGESWLSDEQLRADARGAVKRANEMFDEASDTMRIIGNLALSVQGDAGKLAASLQRTADTLAQAMERVDGLVAAVGRGEGTAGKLLRDPALYDNLNDGAQRLKAALDQANLLLKQIREKGLQVQVP